MKKSILGVMMIVVVGTAASLIFSTRGQSEETMQAANSPHPLEGKASKDIVLGKADAPVTLIEYASFTCPHCANFHKNVFPQIKKNYIDTGKINFIFRDFPLDRVAFLSSIATRCVPQNLFYRTVSEIFQRQRNIVKQENPVAYLTQMVALKGVDSETFRSCMNDAAKQKGVAASRLEGQKKYDVSATPSFILGGETISGGRPYTDFEVRLNKALEDAAH